MPIFHQSSSMLSIKILLISTTIISTGIAVKLYAAPIIDVSKTSVPSLYNTLISWLKPPYLYLVINSIIITIVASSKLQSKFEHVSTPIVTTQPDTRISQFEDVFTHQSVEALGFRNNSYVNFNEVEKEISVDTAAYEGEIDTRHETCKETSKRVGNEFTVGMTAFEGEIDTKHETYKETSKRDNRVSRHQIAMIPSKEVVIVKSAVGKEYSDVSAEKPPAATRFGHHRRTVKASPQGGKTVLKVSKPRRQDTLESTWKTITEGRAMPLTRHLKKSDTWENHGRNHHNLENELHKMTKSETLSDHSETTSPSLRRTHTPAGRLRKDPSLGQDDLNKRVEAFINKFNEDMRLQRQESLNHFMEMINRGAH